MPATNLVFELPAEPADIETQPIEDRAAFAAELRKLADTCATTDQCGAVQDGSLLSCRALC
jgi:hypothetical protein